MEQDILKALEVLKSGGIILYPTETVWGIGCDATNAEAVAKIYALKKRTEEKSMIILLDKVDQVVKYVENVPEIAWQLWEVADKPLTLVLPKAVGIAKNMICDQRTIAIRITSNEFCQKLISKLRRPLVSTSANVSGEVTPVKFEDISKEIVDGVDYVVGKEMAKGASGKASSIILVEEGNVIKILRD